MAVVKNEWVDYLVCVDMTEETVKYDADDLFVCNSKYWVY